MVCRNTIGSSTCLRGGTRLNGASVFRYRPSYTNSNICLLVSSSTYEESLQSLGDPRVSDLASGKKRASSLSWHANLISGLRCFHPSVYSGELLFDRVGLRWWTGWELHSLVICLSQPNSYYKGVLRSNRGRLVIIWDGLVWVRRWKGRKDTAVRPMRRWKER